MRVDGWSRQRSEAAKAEEKRQKQLLRQREREAKEQAKLQAKQDKEHARRERLALKEAIRLQVKQEKEKQRVRSCRAACREVLVTGGAGATCMVRMRGAADACALAVGEEEHAGAAAQAEGG
jgi:hypothetical protein